MKFTWNSWNYDLNGEAYVIAKKECPLSKDVPDYICKNDGIEEKCKTEMVVEEGWCKYQCRSDWDCGEKGGGYVVEKQKEHPKGLNGKKQSGWFPVWIVRKGKWY